MAFKSDLENRVMTNLSLNSNNKATPTKRYVMLETELQENQLHLNKLSAEKRLEWAYAKFGENFVATTSFGIQSSVLLHMLKILNAKERIPVIWVDTGYLPSETYSYADKLSKMLNLDLKVVQSTISPARMEAIYGRLWETNSSNDLEKYHLIRKVMPLDNALKDLDAHCWASGVRGNQTDHRKSMNVIDTMRGKLALRPLLNWSQKDIFYYMKQNKLPQHPLFEKGYSTVGDWHSSGPDLGDNQGRDTRFGGLKQECGIHMPGTGLDGDGI